MPSWPKFGWLSPSALSRILWLKPPNFESLTEERSYSPFNTAYRWEHREELMEDRLGRVPSIKVSRLRRPLMSSLDSPQCTEMLLVLIFKHLLFFPLLAVALCWFKSSNFYFSCFFFVFIFMHGCLAWMYVCVPQACLGTPRPEEGIGSLVTKATDGCEPSCGC